jgi:hypothetical protein
MCTLSTNSVVGVNAGANHEPIRVLPNRRRAVLPIASPPTAWIGRAIRGSFVVSGPGLGPSLIEQVMPTLSVRAQCGASSIASDSRCDSQFLPWSRIPGVKAAQYERQSPGIPENQDSRRLAR